MKVELSFDEALSACMAFSLTDIDDSSPKILLTRFVSAGNSEEYPGIPEAGRVGYEAAARSRNDRPEWRGYGQTATQALNALLRVRVHAARGELLRLEAEGRVNSERRTSLAEKIRSILGDE
jgi:hypothetical protein